MIPEGSLLAGQYNLLAVAFSILIAILGAYVGLDLAAQVRASQGRARRAWLTGSTLAMGIAIWSMHYTGMLAFHLSVPVRYHVPTTVLSFLIAIVGSAIGLYAATGAQFGWRAETIAAFFIGAAIVGLHYTSMASMRAGDSAPRFPLCRALGCDCRGSFAFIPAAHLPSPQEYLGDYTEQGRQRPGHGRGSHFGDALYGDGWNALFWCRFT